MKEEQKEELMGLLILICVPILFITHLYLFLIGEGEMDDNITGLTLYGIMLSIICYVWLIRRKL